MKTNNPGTGLIGVPLDADVDEAEYFVQCPICGQAIDCRDLGQVFHHNEPAHEPIPIDS